MYIPEGRSTQYIATTYCTVDVDSETEFPKCDCRMAQGMQCLHTIRVQGNIEISIILIFIYIATLQFSPCS